MGLRERLQTVTQFFQDAASKGRRLRQAEERGDNHAPSAAEQTGQREARRPGGMTAENRDGEHAGQQRDRDRSS
jgi:hypothetical protein